MKLPSILIAASAVSVILLSACGSDDAGAKTTVSPTDLLQSVILNYKAGTPPEAAQAYRFDKGKIVNVQVSSDTAGQLVITGLDVSQPVKARGSALLIFSANAAGKYDLVLRTESGDALIAKLDVRD